MTILNERIKHFISACKQPALFAQCSSFEGVCAYIDGCNYGLGGCALPGFKQWILSHGKELSNLPWWAVIRSHCFPDEVPVGALDHSKSEVALNVLRQHLEEYLACYMQGGLESVFHRYNLWILHLHDESVLDARKRLTRMTADWPIT